jgi:hypothetical protein
MDRFPPRGFIRDESAVPGITVFSPAPAKERFDSVVDFDCPQCGGESAYSVEDGGLTCTYCGYHEAPEKEAAGSDAESFEFTVETIERSVNGWGIERKELQCKSCGSHITLPAGTLTTHCPFCNSNKVIQHRAPQDVLRPRFLLPFKVSEVSCHDIARSWLGNSWMVPKELRRVAAVDSFTPIYFPFWTFASVADASWRAQVGHKETKRDWSGKKRSEIVWRWESGHVRHRFSNLLIRGSDHVSLYLLGQIDNYDLDELVPYEPQYLAGMRAQAYEISLELAWEKARKRMREDTRVRCHNQTSTDRVRNFSMQLDFQDESWRYILAPLYINIYHYYNEPYQLLINGQTGEIAGQRPVDWRKIGLVLAALILPGILLFLLLYFAFPEAYGRGGGFLSFAIFAVGLFTAIYIALQAQKLDEI